jgi:hypothetical protein
MRVIVLVILATGLVRAQSIQTRKNIPEIARAVRGAVVSIVMSDNGGQPVAQGTGFVVSEDGRIVTNYHVIEEGSSAIVKLPDGALFPVDRLLAADKDRDIAIIKAHGKNFHVVSLGDSDRVQVGDEVVAIGNPLSLDSTVSNGIVSAVRTVQEEGGKFLQVTTPISPGSSGGPLFNMEGQVVGITSMHLQGGENLNFAIPINDVKRLLAGQLAGVRELPDVRSPAASNSVPTTLICLDGVVQMESNDGNTQFWEGAADARSVASYCSRFVVQLPLSSEDADLLEGRSPEDAQLMGKMTVQAANAGTYRAMRTMNALSGQPEQAGSTMIGAIWSLFEQNRDSLCSRHPRMFVFDLNLNGAATQPEPCSRPKTQKKEN